MADLGGKVSGRTDREFVRDHLVEISKFLQVEEPSSSVFEDNHGLIVFGVEVEEPSSVVEDDHDLRDDHAVRQFSAITKFNPPLEEKIMRKVSMEGKCIKKVSSQDLNDSDTSEAPLELMIDLCFGPTVSVQCVRDREQEEEVGRDGPEQDQSGDYEGEARQQQQRRFLEAEGLGLRKRSVDVETNGADIIRC
ncbi:hypothetical protein NL676_034799 [Syzygium grande]|nr:hypothetical protein NL676_034799 [Syzygium grande]